MSYRIVFSGAHSGPNASTSPMGRNDAIDLFAALAPHSAFAPHGTERMRVVEEQEYDAIRAAEARAER